MEEKLENYLKRNSVNYVLHEHPAIFTVEESKKLVKNKTYLHTKSLFLKDENGNFYLVSLPADKRLDMKFLENHFSLKKLKFGSPEELKDKLNLTPGSVSLFGMINSAEVFLIVDMKVWTAERSGFHPNINTSTLEINHDNLQKFYNSLNCRKEIIDFG